MDYLRLCRAVYVHHAFCSTVDSFRKSQKSVMPNTFWFFSILGSTILFIYAVYRRDPVFMLGQSFGMVVYFRNIILIARHKKLSAERKEAS